VKYLGWCADLADALGIERTCCDSCHEDDNQGQSYLNQIDFQKEGYYDCCCLMRCKFEDLMGKK
jgi:hypothetical protein